MRIFAISDLHLEYPENQEWLNHLSMVDYQKDTLILAGNISDSLELIQIGFDKLTCRFANVVFVPGNHDLWIRNNTFRDSFDKLRIIREMAKQFGIHMVPLHLHGITIYPLFSWYDYSFEKPTKALKMIWMDYHYCRWPENYTPNHITHFFLQLNRDYIPVNHTNRVITFSHFLPRIDIISDNIAKRYQLLFPVMGSALLDLQLRQLKPSIHVYGHHHFNLNIKIDGIRYINNALGTPLQSHYLSRKLLCIYKNKY